MFLQIQQIPVVLGPTGTLILGLILFGLAVLNAIQFYKAKNVERLTSALSASETERKVHEEASKRKTEELAEANRKVGELAAKTDLSAVLTMLSETITLTRESVDLSRKFDRENSQLNVSLVRTIEKHGESDKEIFGSIDNSLKHTAEALRELKDEIQSHRKDSKQMVEGLAGKLNSIESKIK